MAMCQKMARFLLFNIQNLQNAKFYSHQIKLVCSNNIDISGKIYQI